MVTQYPDTLVWTLIDTGGSINSSGDAVASSGGTVSVACRVEFQGSARFQTGLDSPELRELFQVYVRVGQSIPDTGTVVQVFNRLGNLVAKRDVKRAQVGQFNSIITI